MAMQGQEVLQAAVSSFQACSISALQAGQAGKAMAAAEQIAACLRNMNAQAAAAAILLALSASHVSEMETLYRGAAGSQARCTLHFLPNMRMLSFCTQTWYGHVHSIGADNRLFRNVSAFCAHVRHRGIKMQ